MTESDLGDVVIPRSTSPMADPVALAKPKRVQDDRGRFRASDAMEGNAVPVVEPVADEPEMENLAPESEVLDNGEKRIPFGQQHARLHYVSRVGYIRRWVNDKPGRIMGAERGGYKHVKDNNGNPVKTHAGNHENGAGMSCYLMEIPEQWYQQDFAFKQESVDETDKAIYGGTFKEEVGDNRYVPKDTPIKFGLSRGAGRG